MKILHVSAAMWAENQALKAFNEIGGNDEEKSAKYVLNRIKKSGSLELSKREILRLCKRFKSAEEFQEPLELLEDMGYIRKVLNKSTGGRPGEKFKINPLLNSNLNKKIIDETPVPPKSKLGRGGGHTDF